MADNKQKTNSLLDDIAKFASEAAEAAQGAGREMGGVIKGKTEKLMTKVDFVPRSEFETLKKDMAKARAEAKKLRLEVDAINSKLGIKPTVVKAPAKAAVKKTVVKKTAIKKPVVRKTAAKKPAAKKPAAKKTT